MGTIGRNRAAIYTRVSTLDQGNGASLETQITDCKVYCKVTGLVAVAEFRDLFSGMSADRVQYLEMLRQAEAGEFDVIVVWKMDRFGRDRLESGFQLRELQKVGVRVDSATEPNDSPLLRNILMDFAEEESRRISQRVTANKRTLAKQGKWTGTPPFGYRVAAHPERGRYLEPTEDAPIVAEVFGMYADGKHTLADIRDYVEAHSQSPIRPRTRGGVHKLLRNPAYTGVIRYGVQSKSKIQLKSKTQIEEDVFESKGAHQPLVDLETFSRAQARLEANQSRGSGRPKSAVLFVGLVWCECGMRYSGRKATGGIYYYCNRRIHQGKEACQNGSVPEKRIRATVIPPIERLLAQLNQGNLRADVRRALMEQVESEKTATQTNKQGVGERLDRLEARLTGLEDAFLDGEITRERYRVRRDQLAEQIAELKAQLAARPHLALPDIDQFFAIADSVTISEGRVTVNGEPLDEQSWRELVEGMVDRIVVEAADGAGQKAQAVIRVKYKPEFEAMIAMAGERGAI